VTSAARAEAERRYPRIRLLHPGGGEYDGNETRKRDFVAGVEWANAQREAEPERAHPRDPELRSSGWSGAEQPIPEQAPASVQPDRSPE
jgi:hypothetical protein